MRIRYLTLLLSLFVLAINAQNTSSGFAMLNQAPVPQSLAISEASTAVITGSASSYVNPALLVMDGTSTIDFGYTSWIEETNYLFGGANFVHGKRAFALNVYSSTIGGFEQRNNPGPSNGDFSVSYLSISGSASFDLEILTIGATAQFLNEENFSYQATGYAFNFGLARSFFDSKLTIGTSVLNLGEMDDLNNTSTELPSVFRLGFSADLFEFAPPKNTDLPILVSLSSDLVLPLEDNTSSIGYSDEGYFNFGVTLEVAETVLISGGYKTGNTAKPVSFGAGFVTDLFTVHYALVPYETGFGTLHSIGVQYKF